MRLCNLEVPRLGIQLELQLLAYTKVTATPDPSCVCDPHHSSPQCWIHWVRPGIKPPTSWILVRFVSAVPWWELQPIYLNASFFPSLNEGSVIQCEPLCPKFLCGQYQQSWKFSCPFITNPPLHHNQCQPSLDSKSDNIFPFPWNFQIPEENIFEQETYLRKEINCEFLQVKGRKKKEAYKVNARWLEKWF